MPSPFSGMDPFLEDPEIWPDFREVYAGSRYERRTAYQTPLPPSVRPALREGADNVLAGRVKRA